MVDRIDAPWGRAHGIPRAASWLVRVDLHLEDGLPEWDVGRWVQSAGVLCSHGRGVDIAVKDERIAGVRGRMTGSTAVGSDPRDCTAGGPTRPTA